MNDNEFRRLYPQNILKGFFAGIPGHIKTAFAASFLLFFLIHHQGFTGDVLNHDNIGHMFGSDYGAASGRWLLPFVLSLNGNFSTPWLIGFAAAVFLAGAVCSVVSVLRIKSVPGVILTAALMTAFPTVACNNFYTFSAEAYMLSLFLACFAAYLTVKFKWGFMGGAVSMCLSLGIYQSYFPVGTALLIGALILELLDNKRDLSASLTNALKYFLTLAVSVLFYMTAVKLTTTNTGLVDYMGISNMGSISLNTLPGLIRNAYENIIDFYLHSPDRHWQSVKLEAAASCFAAAVLGLIIIYTKKPGWKKTAATVLLAAVYPLACGLIYIMAPQADVHMLMVYGFCMVPVGLVSAGEYCCGEINKTPFRGLSGTGSLCLWVIFLSMSLLSWNHAVDDNEFYFKAQLSHEQTQAFSNRLLTCVQQTEGYEKDMPIVLTGMSNADFFDIPQLDRIQVIGLLDPDDLMHSYTYDLYLSRYLGWSGRVYTDGSSMEEEYSLHPQVELMPVYPSQGSIKIIDGAVVVKMS